MFYDGRLEPEPHLDGQRVARRRPPLDGTGPRLLGVPTSGPTTSRRRRRTPSRTLARTSSRAAARGWTSSGVERPVGWADILIVAPYNAQVGEIERRLPAEARVGTVDKFQGQEAPICIYSMTTSSPEHAPRGMEFLYSRNRLNVATSRARCVAIVVASPDLFRVRARTPEQMRLANAFCRFVEMARPARVAAGARTAQPAR